jgi:ABC-type transport system involved in multi-copper enzyme maturation permease subunit
VEAEVQEESKGSMLVGILIGFFGGVLAVTPAAADRYVDPGAADIIFTLDKFFDYLVLMPVLVLGIGIWLSRSVRPSTRSIGIGIMIGLAIALIAGAGACVYWLSTVDLG